MTYLVMRFTVRIPSYVAGLKSNQKVVGCLRYSLAVFSGNVLPRRSALWHTRFSCRYDYWCLSPPLPEFVHSLGFLLFICSLTLL